MLVTESGIVTLVRAFATPPIPGKAKNAELPILVTEFPIVTLVRLLK
jgi:hypothetical protein